MSVLHGSTNSNPTTVRWADAEKLRAEVTALTALLRECQSALNGPADLRQRIEDQIGPRP